MRHRQPRVTGGAKPGPTAAWLMAGLGAFGLACTPEPLPPTPAPEPGEGDRIVYQQSFDSAGVGVLDEATFRLLFAGQHRAIGPTAGRVRIADAPPTTEADRFLRVLYPPDRWAAGGGAIWRIPLDTSVDQAWLSYEVRFAPAFNFVRGGKLPGLGGGEANTGGDRPDGTDGWSARMMWRSGGRAVFYVYHPDQRGRFGDDVPWRIPDGPVRFEPGTWHSVTHHVVLNTPGLSNGRLRGWFDGQLVVDRGDLRFRDTDTFGIDVLLFSTFFGGSGPEWAPHTEQVADFDDFVVWVRPPN